VVRCFFAGGASLWLAEGWDLLGEWGNCSKARARCALLSTPVSPSRRWARAADLRNIRSLEKAPAPQGGRPRGLGESCRFPCQIRSTPSASA